MTDETLPSGDPPATSAPAPGGRIGKYEILRALGSGGMGVVWAARDPDLDREVAIKLLRSADASSELRTRLLREARAMARLKHPNVLTVYEVDSDGTRDFIAMELVDGTSLDVWLRDKPATREVWDAFLAAGRGLAAAHSAGLVHRDFKPHNILRSRDGRVLVTDFGLARGHGDERAVAAASTLPANAALAATLDAPTSQPSAADSVLDLRLTTTGQLLGTPAYMAPEQFAGATPDPRTDQFAFCVALWEALAGERPFSGSTIEELRRETTAGRIRGDGKLPAAVRRVLVRGLAADRANRWPDMPAALRALERARTMRRRRLAVIPPLFGLAAAAFLLTTRHGTHEAAPAACEPGEHVFASAWSPEIRADILAKAPGATTVTGLLDGYRGQWLAGYAQACARPPEKRSAAVDCYLSKRDEVAVFVEMMQRDPAGAIQFENPWDTLSTSEPCSADDPVASPRLPDDARRAKAITFLVQVRRLGLDLLREADRLRTEARSLAWPPLEATLEEQIGAAASRAHDYKTAAQQYRKAAELAHSAHDPLTEARARIGLLEVTREDLLDDIPHATYEDELRDAELAVKNAGNDSALVASLDVNRAAHAVYRDKDLSAGIKLQERAAAVYEQLGDGTRASIATANLAMYLAVRAAPRDLDRAAQMLKTDETRFRFDKFSIPKPVVTARYWIAWLRGDLDGAHGAFRPDIGSIMMHGTKIHGRVIDETGRPVAGARVVTWGHELFGDATRISTDPDFRITQIATTDDHGEFEVGTEKGDALMAELGTRRSVPVPANPEMVLTLGPTHSVRGQIDVGGDPAVGTEPFVCIDATPTSSWCDSTAPTADGHYVIAGIPAAKNARLGAIGSHWPREVGRRVLVGPPSDGATIHWPVGASIELSTKETVGTIWVLRGRVHPKTPAEVDQIARVAPDVASGRLTTIGWGTTAYAGTLNAMQQAREAVLRDNAPGPITACLVNDKVRCTTFEPAETPAPTVRDGRHWYNESALEL